VPYPQQRWVCRLVKVMTEISIATALIPGDVCRGVVLASFTMRRLHVHWTTQATPSFKQSATFSHAWLCATLLWWTVLI